MTRRLSRSPRLPPPFRSRTGIIQVLDAARQEPARTQITDAMIIYERDVLHDVTWRP